MWVLRVCVLSRTHPASTSISPFLSFVETPCPVTPFPWPAFGVHPYKTRSHYYGCLNILRNLAIWTCGASNNWTGAIQVHIEHKKNVEILKYDKILNHFTFTCFFGWHQNVIPLLSVYGILIHFLIALPKWLNHVIFHRILYSRIEGIYART